MYIVALTGNIGSGKSYIADKLNRYLLKNGVKSIILPFALPLKKSVKYIYSIYGLSEPKFNFNRLIKFINLTLSKHYKIDDTITKDIITKFYNLNLHNEKDERIIIQKFGTELMRSFDENIWINLWKAELNQFINDDICVIVDDLRFINEYNTLKTYKNVKTIRVIRPLNKILKSLNITKTKYKTYLSHQSEQELANIKTDFVIENNETNNDEIDDIFYLVLEDIIWSDIYG